MSAPQKATGGRTTTTKPGTRPTPARSSAPKRPPRGRLGGGSSGNKGDGALPKPPQGHAGFERPLGSYRPPRRDGVAPRYTNKSVKEQMLAVAIEAATERGYESMRISEITEPVGVTRQAFYAHFRDKRHCMCEAVDPKLGVVERMVASLSDSDPDAAARLAHSLDDLLCDRFGSQEGTRGRIVGAMIALLREHASFHKVRIGALVKAAHVPPGDFYRQFSGKSECFAVAYEQLLDELVAEVRSSLGTSGGSAEPRHEVPVCPAEHSGHELRALLRSLVGALHSDDQRRHILVVEMAHLPDQAPNDVDGVRKSAVRSAVAALLADCEGIDEADPRLTFASASILELIRSAEVGGAALTPADLEDACRGLRQGHAFGASALAA